MITKADIETMAAAVRAELGSFCPGRKFAAIAVAWAAQFEGLADRRVLEAMRAAATGRLVGLLGAAGEVAATAADSPCGEYQHLAYCLLARPESLKRMAAGVAQGREATTGLAALVARLAAAQGEVE